MYRDDLKPGPRYKAKLAINSPSKLGTSREPLNNPCCYSGAVSNGNKFRSLTPSPQVFGPSDSPVPAVGAQLEGTTPPSTAASCEPETGLPARMWQTTG